MFRQLMNGSCFWRSCGLLAVPAVLFAFVTRSPAGEEERSPALRYEQEIKPLLGQYCYDCHGEQKKRADLSLQDYADAAGVRKDRATWEEVLRRLRNREMPPEGKPQPTDPEREGIAGWIETELFPVDCDRPDPGRVTIRRLNRAEYNNTVRDLLGVTLQPAADFPADDTGYGFDNIGDVLSLSPLLLERYLAAAAKLVEAAIPPTSARQFDGLFPAPMPESYRRIFTCQPGPETTNECARAILSRFALRAFRRPATEEEVGRLCRIAESVRADGGSFEESIKVALQAALVSPHFLFRGELQPEPDNPRSVVKVNDYALASRLSYFLWSSMPDDELFALAEKNQLRAQLDAQIRRMLDDPKAHALVENFSGQWLQTRALKEMAPDAAVFPGFDEALRSAMARETELFFAHVMDQDRSVLEFLTADYTFLNERLARHYGVEGVEGPDFRRVFLKNSPRGGVLTHGSVLTLTSNPTRTSPVKRGKWVLENLLAQAPPPPPPNVPPLSETREAANASSLRERMEQHRADPMCSSCHAIMDPIGFGLENFDGIGAWREQDGRFPIDPSGKLQTGESFAGAPELRRILAVQKRDQFVRCLVEKMLTYALGRGLHYYDRCAVDKIAAGLARENYRFTALITGVIQSAPFQMRRGEGDLFSVTEGR